MRNRIFNMFIIGAVAISTLFVGKMQVSAAEVINQQENTEMVMTQGENGVSRLENGVSRLSIVSGKAEVIFRYDSEVVRDSIIVSTRLQKYVGGKWERVKIWDDVKSSGMVCDVSKSCQVTSKGKYRAKFVVTTKKGNNQNTENFYSKVVDY